MPRSTPVQYKQKGGWVRWQVESGSERCSSTARRCGRAAEGWQCGGCQGDAEWTRQDIVEHRRMTVEVPAARGCCEKAGGRWDHSGRWHRRLVWRWKMHWKAEDASEAEAESETERHGIRGFYQPADARKALGLGMMECRNSCLSCRSASSGRLAGSGR